MVYCTNSAKIEQKRAEASASWQKAWSSVTQTSLFSCRLHYFSMHTNWPRINFEGSDESCGWERSPSPSPSSSSSSSSSLFPSVTAGIETNLQIVLCLRAHLFLKSNWPSIPFMTTLNQTALFKVTKIMCLKCLLRIWDISKNNSLSGKNLTFGSYFLLKASLAIHKHIFRCRNMRRNLTV